MGTPTVSRQRLVPRRLTRVRWCGRQLFGTDGRHHLTPAAGGRRSPQLTPLIVPSLCDHVLDMIIETFEQRIDPPCTNHHGSNGTSAALPLGIDLCGPTAACLIVTSSGAQNSQTTLAGGMPCQEQREDAICGNTTHGRTFQLLVHCATSISSRLVTIAQV